MKKIGLFVLLWLAACSTTPDDLDPNKEFNKDMLELNLTIDRNVLKPTAETYKEVVPDDARDSVSNFLSNLKEPFYLINYLAIGNAEYAANSLFRFVINSTFGILGLFDIAEQIGLEKAETSHKTTLKKWDVPTGDYLVLPVFGPSSTRDAIAEPVSWFIDPIGYFIGFPWMCVKFVCSTINDRAENAKVIDSTIENSMDLYATTKSLYLQKYGNDKDDSEDDDTDEDDSHQDNASKRPSPKSATSPKESSVAR